MVSDKDMQDMLAPCDVITMVGDKTPSWVLVPLDFKVKKVLLQAANKGLNTETPESFLVQSWPCKSVCVLVRLTHRLILTFQRTPSLVM